jgi:hypothetical protein
MPRLINKRAALSARRARSAHRQALRAAQFINAIDVAMAPYRSAISNVSARLY